LEVAQSEYAAAELEYEETVAALQLAEKQRDEVTAQLEQDEALAAKSKQSLSALARDAMMGYTAGDSDLLVLLGATSIYQAANDLMAADVAARARSAVITQAQQSAGANKNRKARLESVTAEIVVLKARAEAALAAAETARALAEEAKQELEDLKASLEGLAADLAAKKAADEAKRKALEAESAQIQKEIDKLLAEEAARNNVKPGTGPPPATPGFFGRPLSSLVVVSPFGYRIHPIWGDWRLHMGVDLSASCGTPIYASAAGRVIFAGWGGANGYRLVISHGNVSGRLMFSTYNHIQEGGILVSVGQDVSKAQQVARVGTTGWSTGCHLHFEIGVDSASGVVNPMSYIQ
jgi:murein DD-endopeptidase MepM/ murein hydrolase activator NlpD